MLTPEDWKTREHPTIVLGHVLAERVDPLDEWWLALEELLVELLEEEHIVYGEDRQAELGSMWAS